MCNFGRKYYGEHYWEIFFKFGPVVQQELSFKQKFLDGQMLDLRQNTRAHTAKIADWDEKDQNNLLNQSIELYISIFE